MTAPPQLVLAIDTASPEASIALADGNGLKVERRWAIETTISKELLAEIDALLSETGIAPGDLDAIALCVGPGSYGGLRSGIATAQGLALALDIPIAAISRFEADAVPHLADAPTARAVVAVHDAGRSGLGWAAYACPAETRLPVELVPPTMSSVEDCVAAAPAGAIWCGEVTEALAAALAEPSRESDSTARLPVHSRASAMLELARKRDNYDDPALADAVYLRPPAITRPKTTPS